MKYTKFLGYETVELIVIVAVLGCAVFVALVYVLSR